MSNFDTCQLIETSGNIRTPKARLSYPYLLSRNPNNKKTDRKTGAEYNTYSTALLIPPTADITMLKEAARDAAIEKHTAEKIKSWQERDKWNTPFLDAFQKSKTDKNPNGEEWLKGWTMIRVDSKNAPGVVNALGQKVEDTADVYAGRWAVVSLAPFAYDPIDGGKAGVKFFLQNVQLLDHDKPIGGARPQAEDEFAPVEGIEDGSSTDSVMDDEPKTSTDSVMDV